MTIDRTGEWWTGTEAADIGPYLNDLVAEEESLPIDQFKLARCACGSLEFRVLGDGDEGCAQRTCVACNTAHYICDSAKYWSEATPQKLACAECKSDAFNVGVGFALRRGKQPELHWITIGERCVKCGVLGSFADWKIDYSPSIQLLDQV